MKIRYFTPIFIETPQYSLHIIRNDMGDYDLFMGKISGRAPWSIEDLQAELQLANIHLPNTHDMDKFSLRVFGGKLAYLELSDFQKVFMGYIWHDELYLLDVWTAEEVGFFIEAATQPTAY